MKPLLNVTHLIEATKRFCKIEEKLDYPALYGVTDGKTVGTFY